MVLIGGSYIGTRGGGHADGARRSSCTMLMHGGGHARARLRARRWAASSRACSRSTASRCIGGDELERFEGADGRVRKVVTKGGMELDCGCVVIGAGVVPDVMLAAARGSSWARAAGVACSSRLETLGAGASSPPATSPSTTRRCTAARAAHRALGRGFEHGKTAALNMLGRDAPHEVVPVLLLRPRRLGDDRVRGPGLGRHGAPRLARRRRVHRVLRRRRAGDGRADGRAARTTWSTRAASSRRSAKPDPAALADLDSDLAEL